MNFQRSSGLGLSYCEYGSTRLALSAPSRKITLGCRLFPFGIEVHSNPMKAVKRPGSLYFSAAALLACQAERMDCGLSIGACLPPRLWTMSETACIGPSP